MLTLAAWLCVGCLPQSRPESHPAPEVPCEILIVGGTLGGVAAALGAAGRDLWLVEDSDWIGGQATAQGVSALDEHRYIEFFGGTRTYTAFRDGIRARNGGRTNPGGGWVSRLCFLPRTGLAVLEAMTEGVRILRSARVTSADVVDDRVVAVTVIRADGSPVRFRPQLVLDASDLGDLLPLCGAEFRTGAEARAETGEPHALELADPDRQQSFTYCFAVEWCPGEHHVIAPPSDYPQLRDGQPYTLTLRSRDQGVQRFGFRQRLPGTPGAFFTYRQIAPGIALINWPGNDYRGTPMLRADHDAAKRLALGFLYWLQTECPRDEGGLGYPELRLRKDVMDTADGLSRRPYVREGRRLVARTVVREQDIAAGADARGRLFPDSVGVGYYPMDLHSCHGDPDERQGHGLPTAPFQIPLGSLLPVRLRNLVAAGKCLGVTHVTNGAYRLHPVEWAVGEAAGHLARFCLERGVAPAAVADQEPLRRAFQVRLLESGVPIFWFVDLAIGHPLFVPAQALATWGRLTFDARSLQFGVEDQRLLRTLEQFRQERPR